MPLFLQPLTEVETMMFDLTEVRTPLVCSQCGKPVTPIEVVGDVQGLRTMICADETTGGMPVKSLPDFTAEDDDQPERPKVDTSISLFCEEGHWHFLHVRVNEETGGTDLVIEYERHR
jgi:hypothetical protein